MNIERFVIKANEQGASRETQCSKTLTSDPKNSVPLDISKTQDPLVVSKTQAGENITNPCLPRFASRRLVNRSSI